MNPDVPRAAPGRMTIGRLLFVGSTLTAVLAAALLAAGLAALITVGNAKDSVVHHASPVLTDAERLHAAVADRAVAVRDLLLTREGQFRQQAKDADTAFDGALTRLRQNVTTATERQLLSQIPEQKARWDAAVNDAIRAMDAGTLAIDEVPQAIHTQLIPERSALDTSAQQLVDEAERVISNKIDASDRTATLAKWVMGFLGALLIAAAFAVSWWTGRRVTRRVTGMALTIDSAAAEVLAGASQQVSGAAEQATAVQETVTTVDELVQTAEQSTQRARVVAQRAHESADVAEQGRRAVEEATRGMDAIRSQVQDIAETVAVLAERAEAISDIVGTVDAIAAQTHLLAVNASIEAARAGDQGRGFSVIAGEVRGLADESRQTTARVGAIVEEITDRTNRAVMATEEGIKTVDAGAARVTQAGDTIVELADTIASAALAAEQIAASAGQQSAATTQISHAMRDLDQVMQQTVTAARQGEQAARELDGVAGQLKQLVGAG